MVATPLIEPDVPGWMQRFVLRLPQTFKSLFPKAPERLASFLYADLPPAANWPGAQVWVSDKSKVGVSNGTTWTNTIGGAL